MNAGAQTIYAPASGSGRAGIAVIRISGPAADAALARLTSAPLPEPRRAARRTLSEDGTWLDDALVLRFAQGASFTGEAMVELHCHGGPAVVRAVLDALGRMPGLRLAEPGEFAMRAVLNGRMDLAEAEALGDLLAAETEAQRRQAARGVGGALHARVDSWRDRLVRAAALLEVTIDWVDEEVPEDVGPEVGALLSGVADEIHRELTVSDRAARLRTGLEVALLGAPNAGKSSLLNALAGRDAAIAAPTPGTTRDVVELRFDLDGLPVVFLDMAGLRETDDPVERLGVEKARARAASADLRLLLAGPECPFPESDLAVLARPGDLQVATKSDLGMGWDGLAVSAATGAGIPDLLAAVGAALGPLGDVGLVSHERQARELARAEASLRSAASGAGTRETELLAEDLRDALRALERLIGRVGVEDVLDRVFASFCLGK